MTGTDALRAELRELAGSVAPTDLYERSLARSHRIGRREAVVGTTAAVLALALLGSGLWQLPRARPAASLPALSASSRPTATVPAPAPEVAGATAEQQFSGEASRPERPRPARSPERPRSTSIADLPGHVFYADPAEGGRLVRLTPGRAPQTVFTEPYSALGVSPDGSRLAYVSDGALLVVPIGGTAPQRVYPGTASDAQAPAWSPDGARLLVDAAEPGVLEVATGTLTPLPSGLAGQQFRWSGDGSVLVYGTAGCGLEVAEPGAPSGVPVPEPADPAGRSACRPVSVDATGDLVAVQLAQSVPGSSALRARPAADAVLDTVTGDIVDLPVPGEIIGAVFDPGGNLLVRSVVDGEHRLSLFAPGFTLLLRATEPPALRHLDLVAHTR